MPQPLIKRGTWVKERERNKDGRWRKKRLPNGKRRPKCECSDFKEYKFKACENCEHKEERSTE